MTKPKKYIDPIFLSIFGLFIAVSIYMHFVYNYILPVNYYPGLFCWLIALGLKIYNTKREYFLVLLLLILYSLNIINFTVERFNINIAGIILLIIYAIINT